MLNSMIDGSLWGWHIWLDMGRIWKEVLSTGRGLNSQDKYNHIYQFHYCPHIEHNYPFSCCKFDLIPILCSASLSMLPWPKPAIWPSIPPDASSEVLMKEKASSWSGLWASKPYIRHIFQFVLAKLVISWMRMWHFKVIICLTILFWEQYTIVATHTYQHTGWLLMVWWDWCAIFHT